MGIADRYIEYRDNQSKRRFTLGQPGNALIALITLNIIFFLTILITRVFYLYTHQGQGMEVLNFDAIEWFALPAQLTKFSERPWTLLTFMFSQGGLPAFSLLVAMFSNMLWLYAFGFILQDLSGNRLIFPVYIYGSIAGAVLFMASVYLIPSLRPYKEQLYLAGANTGTMAIAISVTAFAPNYRLFRNIGHGAPVWILTGLFLVVSLVSSLSNNTAFGMAILGGAAAGLLFVILLKKGKDGSIWMNDLYKWFIKLYDPGKKQKGASVKEKIFYNSGSRSPYNKTANITEQRINEILDKINQKGYHFLTDEEKEILKRAGEE